MEIQKAGKLKACKHRHQTETSHQTGFPSPATHYAEPSIDISQELIGNKEATFFVRVKGNNLSCWHIYDNDVLIIDRSLPVKVGKLILAIVEGEFQIQKVDKKMTAINYWGAITYIIHSTL